MSKTLQQKAIEASAKRTEIAGEVNTEWTPMTKFHGVDYTNNQYITMKTELEDGIYTFQVKVEDQGLVLDVFLHVGDEDEHVITKTAWYEDLGLKREDWSFVDKAIKRYKPTQ